MDAGTNNVIYMDLHSGPNMGKGTFGKANIAGTIDWDSTVYKHLKYVTSYSVGPLINI
jgi:hypothetical protein